MPDTDSPYIFGLPENIERSLQRTLSTAVIGQLRTLSAHDVEATKFDRERWRTQLSPILDLWQQLTSSTPGIISFGNTTIYKINFPFKLPPTYNNLISHSKTLRHFY